MSKKARVTEKSTTVETREIAGLTCHGCGGSRPWWAIIDQWCIVEGKNYCLSCQKRIKIGWYKKKNT